MSGQSSSISVEVIVSQSSIHVAQLLWFLAGLQVELSGLSDQVGLQSFGHTRKLQLLVANTNCAGAEE
jgi:hypothetical protein